MIRDFKYIIKRIIVGVSIALILSYLRGNLVIGVSALEIGGISLPGVTTNISSATGTYTWYPPNFGYFSNWGSGYLRFDFSLSTNSQATSTSPFAFSRGVIAYSDNVPYVCEVGSPSVNNSTYVATTYSAVCPMNMTNGGIGQIDFKFGSLGTSAESSYTFSLMGVFSYEQAPQNQVNVDMSSLNNVTNSINNQIANDNTNTQNIINSQNNTTNAINDVNDSINDDDVDEANDEITDFFDDFDSGSTGTLTDIISLPLNFLDNLNNTCSPLVLPLPYLNQDLTIPCISTYLSQFVPSSLINLIKLLINGFLCYRIISSFIVYINQLKDPNNNDLEVMDL